MLFFTTAAEAHARAELTRSRAKREQVMSDFEVKKKGSDFEVVRSPLTPAGEAERAKHYLAFEALRITSGERRKAYGPPENNFARIARFWDAYFKNTGRNIDVTAADVSPLMRLMKEARLCETPDHLDSFVDLVGYTLTGSEVNGVKAPPGDRDATDGPS